MLEYLSDKEKLLSKELYKQAFNKDSESFVDYYYSEKTKDNKSREIGRASCRERV